VLRAKSQKRDFLHLALDTWHSAVPETAARGRVGRIGITVPDVVSVNTGIN
jgi:hypothetical protein